MGLRPWDLAGPQIARLKFDLLRDAGRIIDLDPEITHGALQLCVAEQQLNCSQVAGLLVNLCRLRSAQRMRAICRAIEPGAVRPSMDDAGVLPRRQVRLSPETTREQLSTQDSTFNAAIRRPVSASPFDGLATYLVVPNKAMTTTKAMSTFTVAYVKNPPG
jgi:hypothetical protein